MKYACPGNWRKIDNAAYQNKPSQYPVRQTVAKCDHVGSIYILKLSIMTFTGFHLIKSNLVWKVKVSYVKKQTTEVTQSNWVQRTRGNIGLWSKYISCKYE